MSMHVKKHVILISSLESFIVVHTKFSKSLQGITELHSKKRRQRTLSTMESMRIRGIFHVQIESNLIKKVAKSGRARLI